MLITRTSLTSGKTRERDLPVTRDEMERWINGELIQEVWPELSSDDREWIMTGITPGEWEGMTDDD